MDTTINDLFDTRTALSGLYLWLLFGYLSSMISCDLQKLMTENNAIRHIVGIIAFFFLFTLIDSQNKSHIHIGYIWLKTLIVYLIFILMTKSKWYFSISVLLLLIIDQSIKLHHDYMKNRNKQDPGLGSLITWRNYLSIGIYTIIGIGFIHYGLRQYKHFGSTFSWIKLLLHYGCKGI